MENVINNEGNTEKKGFLFYNNKKKIEDIINVLRPGKVTAILSLLIIVAAIPIAMHLLSQPTNLPTKASTAPIAQDTFQRANQSLWGVSSDGHLWSGDANTSKDFSINGNVGQIKQSGSGSE